MKKFTFRSLLAIAAAGVLFTACKDENDDGNTSKTTYEFSVKAEDNPISAPADGKTYTILVTSTKTAQAGTSAVAYEVVSSPEWAPAELEQTALVITVAKNSSTEAREPGKVVLKQDESDKTLEITINQAGFSNSMSLDATYSTDRCKVLVIEPTITGFDQNPVYKWTVKGPNDAEVAQTIDIHHCMVESEYDAAAERTEIHSQIVFVKRLVDEFCVDACQYRGRRVDGRECQSLAVGNRRIIL